MPILSKLIVKLSVDADEFKKGIDTAKSQAEAGTKSISSSFADIQGTITGISVGIFDFLDAFDRVGQAVHSVIDPVVEYGEQVRALKYSIGATAEEASKLIQAADDVRVEFGVLEVGLQAAIRKGIEPSIEGIARLADQYTAIGDPIAKTKFLMDSFGRSGAELAPLMALGAEGIRELGQEAQAAGIVLTEEAMRGIEAYQGMKDAWGDMVLGYKIQLSREYLPGLVQAGTSLLEFRGKLQTVIGEWYNNLDATEKNLLALVRINPFWGKAEGQIRAFARAQAEAAQEAQNLNATVEQTQKVIMGLRGVIGDARWLQLNPNVSRGNYYTDSVPGRASGGHVGPGRLYQVGERGWELLATGTPGTIFSHEQSIAMMRGLGGVDTSEMTVELRKLRELIAAQGRPATSDDVERAVRDGILKAMAFGGG